MVKSAKNYILFAGGGTGGHIFPAIAIAQALQKIEQSLNLHFVGAIGKMEMEKVPAAGFSITGLPIAGLDRNLSLKNLLLPIKILKSIYISYQIIKKYQPKLIVGVGGYASAPLLWVGQKMGIKTVIQEQNAFAGIANKILGKKAVRAYVAFDSMSKFFPNKIILKTGNPVRDGLIQSKLNRQESIASLGLQSNKPIILVTGGSLGALSINQTLLNQINELIDNNIQVIWQTGSLFFNQNQEKLPIIKGCIIQPFISDMALAFAAADLVVCRSGASTLSELAVVKKPAILIPLPTAAENHQTHNANSFALAGAALVIENNKVTELLISTIKNLINDKEKLAQMALNMASLAKPEAASSIALDILSIIKKPSHEQ